MPKGEDSIRLIIDARPANAAFVDPPKVQLPTPDLLARLHSNSNQPLYVAKVDLDNFYHRLRLPTWMRPYFALPPVTAEHVGMSTEFGSGTLIYPCCTTLPMGWSHSVYVAQMAHEHLLNSSTPLQPCDRIHADGDFRLDRMRHQVYIDDLNLFGHDPDALARIQSHYVQTVSAVGLPVKPSKVVAPSCHGVECVGLEVHGTHYEVGLSAAKLTHLCQDTFALLRSGLCTGLELSKLVGRWTWAVLVCRPALSVFSAVYRFIECARSRLFSIWPSVCKELMTMAGLAPLLFANMQPRWFQRVIATDASESGQGVVAARVSEAVMFDMADRKPVQPEPIAPDDTSTDQSFSRPTDFGNSEINNASWHTIVAAPWQQPEHINSLEVRAVSTAVRWVLSSPYSIRHRVLVLSDSLVTVFSVTKGRSSSRVLLPRLRQLASCVLGSGLQLFVRWIPTEINPADEPSRRFQSSS